MQVHSASENQYREVSQALGRAFAEDPVMAYIFPRAEGRAQRIAGIMRMGIKNYGIHGRVDFIDEMHACSVWQQPNAPKPSIYAQLADALEGLCKLRSSMMRAALVQQLMAKHRLREPHWYLAILGTVPEWQGKSLGGRLLDSVLNDCDREGRVAYLESSNIANVPFYQRHGFVVSEELALPDGPIIRTMCRDPR